MRDLDYPEDYAACMQVSDTPLFPLFHSGNCETSFVDELGGSQLDGGIGVEPEWARIAYVEFTAVHSEYAEDEFCLEPAISESSAYNRGLVPTTDIEYGCCSLEYGTWVPVHLRPGQ